MVNTPIQPSARSGAQLEEKSPFINRLRFFNKRITNRLTMRFAGKRIYAVLHHRGRRSGKPYQTPVVAVPDGGSFVFPLPYGANADWCQNLMAAGEARMEWRGGVYHLVAPRLIEPQEAVPAFPKWLHPLLRNTKIYLKLDRGGPPELPGGKMIRKILVYGAGVLGSLYAGKLAQAGYEVTLLARGPRLEELQRDGLVLVDDATGIREQIPIQVTARLAPDDSYDLVLVVVRKDQLPSILPSLAANTCTPNVLFLVNNAAGPEELVEALGGERVLLGFPGAGGQRSDGVVRYRLIPGSFQPTTIGELDGRKTQRLDQIARILAGAGFPVAISPNMDAWLKTHVALVSPIANALYLAGGSSYRLAHTPDGLLLLVRAVKEGHRVLQTLGIPITPGSHRLLAWIPEPLIVAVLRRGLMAPQNELQMAQHAIAARDEMRLLAEEFRRLKDRAGIPTPAIDALACYLDPAHPALPEGQAELEMDWRSTIAALVALLSAAVLAGWLLSRRRK